MKYCIRKDRPLTGLAGGYQFLGGCEIYGVHHDCVGCPNLVDMGDGSYSATTVADNTMVQEEKPKTPAEKIHAAVEKLRQGLPCGWRSAKDEKPNPSEWVVVCVKDHGTPQCLALATYNEELDRWFTDQFEDGEPEEYFPDYWLRLPELKK